MEKLNPRVYGVPALKNFACLADKCQDNCCHSWDMPVDGTTEIIYREMCTELADSMTTNSSNQVIMRREQDTGCCNKYEHGLCTIHAKYGSNLLSDSCHFYPSQLWQIGKDGHWQGGTLSCPAMAKLLLQQVNLLATEYKLDRMPHDVKTLEVGGIEFSKLVNLHFDLIGIISTSTELSSQSLSQLHSIILSLMNFPEDNWPELISIYRQHPYSQFVGADSSPDQELQLLVLLVHLIKHYNYKVNERLAKIIKPIASLFGAEINWIEGTVSYKQCNLPEKSLNFMSDSTLDALLKRYIIASMVASFYPFAGQGDNASERSWWMTIKTALVRFAISAFLYQHFEGNIKNFKNWMKLASEEELLTLLVDIVQPLSRILDHLPNLEIVQNFAYERNWHLESSVNGLLRTYSLLNAL